LLPDGDPLLYFQTNNVAKIEIVIDGRIAVCEKIVTQKSSMLMHTASKAFNGSRNTRRSVTKIPMRWYSAQNMRTQTCGAYTTVANKVNRAARSIETMLKFIWQRYLCLIGAVTEESVIGWVLPSPEIWVRVLQI
jgi:hypothetical protein